MHTVPARGLDGCAHRCPSTRPALSKEISYIHAEAYPAGELKHGPLALVDADMPVVAVAPNDELLVFADDRVQFTPRDGLTVLAVPSVHELVAPLVFTVPLQLLAYHVAVLKGTDVDKPRNLAKSVTLSRRLACLLALLARGNRR